MIIGIGLGLLLSGLIYTLIPSGLSDYQVEKKARDLGMIYPGKIKVLDKEETTK